MMMPHKGHQIKIQQIHKGCCLLLKKGNPQGYMVTQTVATLAGFSRCHFLTQLQGAPPGMPIISRECLASDADGTWTPALKALCGWHGSHHRVSWAPAPPPSPCFSLQSSAGLGFFLKSQGGSCSSLSSFLFLAGLLWLRQSRSLK